MNEYLQQLLDPAVLILTGVMSSLCICGAVFATVSFWRIGK